jgi:NitT/TauT family transport system substrate-binding protein
LTLAGLFAPLEQNQPQLHRGKQGSPEEMTMMRTSMLRHGLCAGALIGTALAAAPVQAQVTDLAAAMPTTSLTFSAHYVAEDMGFFKEEGLRVSTSVVTGIGAANAVLAGGVQFSNGSGVTVVRGAARGQPLQAIGVALDKPPLEVVLAKSQAEKLGIKPDMPIEERASRLRGLRLGIVGVNTIPHGYLRFFLRKGGLDPERDVVTTPMAPPAMIAGIKSGAIDGFVMSQPWTVMAVHEGIAVPVASSPRGDLKELEPTNYNVVIARRDYCPANPDTCRRILRAYQKALTLIREKPEQARAALRKRFAEMDRAVFDEAFEVVRAGTPATTRISLDALKNDQDFMLQTGMMRKDEALKSFDGVYTNDFQP